MLDNEILKGRAWACGDYTDCLQILPQQYWMGGDKVGSIDKTELGTHVMEEVDPSFAQEAAKGTYQFIVSGNNFGGGGKSIEHPVIAIKGLGIKAVIADSISRYFFRNSINNGLVVLTVAGISKGVKTGDELTVDIENGKIVNETTKKIFKTTPLSGIVKKIIQADGYINYIKAQMSSV